jgi:hypothetical protein
VKVSIKKEYLNDCHKHKCRVTFLIPKKIGENAKRAHVVGEFNNWTQSDTPMKKLKNGTFIATIELPIGREYQFRYLLDNNIWMNDSDADSFVPTPFGDSENCVLTTYDDTHIEVIKSNQLKPRPSTSNLQPLMQSFQEKSSPTESLLLMLRDQLQAIRKIYAKSSLALKS